MSVYRPPKPNQLTSESFACLLAALDADEARAAQRYEQLRRALIVFFEFRGSAHPADDADETFDRVGRRLCEGQEIFTANPQNYFYAVARNVWRERQAQPVKEIPLEEALPFNAPDVADPLELLEQAERQRAQEQRLACLETCLQQLSVAERGVIVAYYQGSGRDKIRNRQALAQRLNIQPNALRIRACRLRDRLEHCVSHCQKKALRG